MTSTPEHGHDRLPTPIPSGAHVPLGHDRIRAMIADAVDAVEAMGPEELDELDRDIDAVDAELAARHGVNVVVSTDSPGVLRHIEGRDRLLDEPVTRPLLDFLQTWPAVSGAQAGRTRHVWSGCGSEAHAPGHDEAHRLAIIRAAEVEAEAIRARARADADAMRAAARQHLADARREAAEVLARAQAELARARDLRRAAEHAEPEHAEVEGGHRGAGPEEATTAPDRGRRATWATSGRTADSVRPGGKLVTHVADLAHFAEQLVSNCEVTRDHGFDLAWPKFVLLSAPDPSRSNRVQFSGRAGWEAVPEREVVRKYVYVSLGRCRFGEPRASRPEVPEFVWAARNFTVRSHRVLERCADPEYLLQCFVWGGLDRCSLDDDTVRALLTRVREQAMRTGESWVDLVRETLAR